jgi:hypothetical protein
MASSSAPSAGLAGQRYLSMVALLALLSTVPMLLVVAVGTAVLMPGATGGPSEAPYPFLTYAPGPPHGEHTPAADLPGRGRLGSDPPTVKAPAPVTTGRDVFMVGCGW